MWMKQTRLTPDEVSCKTFTALKYYSELFFAQVKEDQYSDEKNSVDLIMQLREVSADVEEHFGSDREMRKNVHSYYTDEEGVAPYHSGHVAVVRKLMDTWIIYKQQKQNGANSVNKSDVNKSDEWNTTQPLSLKVSEKRQDRTKKFVKASSLEAHSMPPIEEEVV